MTNTHQAEVAAIESFSTEFTAGNKKLAMKDAAGGSSENWKVFVKSLRTAPGFNARLMTPKRTAHIRWLADQIKEHGFHEHEPLGGYVAVEDGKQVVYVTSGHNRHAAVELLISEGEEILKVPFIAVPKETTMADLTAQIVTGNSGMPLTTYEKGLVCKRLRGYGWETDEICRKLGMKSRQYVDNLLMLVGAPAAIREMVINEETSAENAIDALHKHGDRAYEELQSGMAKAKAAGKTRVTGKHMSGFGFAKAVKKAAPAMLATLRDVRKDPGFEQINEQLRTNLLAMLAELEQVETSDAAAKAAADGSNSAEATGGATDNKAGKAAKAKGAKAAAAKEEPAEATA